MFCYRQDNKPELSKQWHCLGRLRDPLLAVYYFGQALFLFMRAASPYVFVVVSDKEGGGVAAICDRVGIIFPPPLLPRLTLMPGERTLCSPPLPDPLQEDHVHLPS